ncbi:outer membrane protein assembly factor BamB family protein [Nocardiopsis dassonvillei]|uniref:outer membrane protein assembly factor BamB family protein n=1 Tax=Nocardiopsis dassonvillei TaxID=2014 RepID=UPI0036733F04
MSNRMIGALCAALVLSLSSCSTEGSAQEESPEPVQEEVHPHLGFDPPREFAPDSTVEINNNAVAVGRGGTAYAVLHEMGDTFAEVVEVDLLTGEYLWVHQLSLTDEDKVIGHLIDTDFRSRPRTNGDLVFVSHIHDVPQRGTRPFAKEVHAVALDSEDGSVAWSTQLSDSGGVGTSTRVLGANNDWVLVIEDQSPQIWPKPAVGEIYLLEASTGDVVWSAEEYTSARLEGDIVLVSVADEESDTFGPAWGSHRRSALEAATGETLWESEEFRGFFGWNTPTDSLQGSGLALVSGNLAGEEGERSNLLDASTGVVVHSFEGNALCHFDSVDVLVCETRDDQYGAADTLLGFNTETHEELWRFADDRVIPTLHTAHKGLVYVEANGVPVILDARSGEDEVAEAKIAPRVVMDGFGLVLDEEGASETSVHPATA